jgi:hypothetical protein
MSSRRRPTEVLVAGVDPAPVEALLAGIDCRLRAVATVAEALAAVAADPPDLLVLPPSPDPALARVAGRLRAAGFRAPVVVPAAGAAPGTGLVFVARGTGLDALAIALDRLLARPERD